MLEQTSSEVLIAPLTSNPASPNPAPTTGVSPKRRRTTKRRTEPLRTASADAYAKDVRLFKSTGGAIPCTAEALENYIRSLRNKLAPQTIHRRAMAVRHEHLRLGYASPTESPALKTLLRQLQLGVVPARSGSAPTTATKRKEPQSAKPVTRQLLSKMLDALGTNALDRRDRCLLLLGFAAALSRSALVALDVADLRFTNDVMVISVRVGDDDQARTVSVPITGHELCAATATRAWIAHAGLDIEGGPLLRRFDRGGDPTPQRLDSAWVSVVVKSRLKAVGVDPEHYSGLSLPKGRLLELGKGVL